MSNFWLKSIYTRVEKILLISLSIIISIPMYVFLKHSKIIFFAALASILFVFIVQKHLLIKTKISHLEKVIDKQIDFYIDSYNKIRVNEKDKLVVSNDFEMKLKKHIIRIHSKKPVNFLSKQLEKITTDYIIMTEKLPSEYITFYWFYLDKKKLFVHQQLEENFLEKIGYLYPVSVSVIWKYISEYQKMSSDFILQNMDRLHYELLMKNVHLGDQEKEEISGYFMLKEAFL